MKGVAFAAWWQSQSVVQRQASECCRQHVGLENTIQAGRTALKN